MDLTERNKWIEKRYKELKQTNTEIYNNQIFQQISEELNKEFPLLWINWQTVRFICKKYGYYKNNK
jgi:hypothetical protein